MLEQHDANALASWLVAAGESELKSFAAAIRRDYDAALARCSSSEARARWRAR